MSGNGKRGVVERPKLPRPSSTLPVGDDRRARSQTGSQWSHHLPRLSDAIDALARIHRGEAPTVEEFAAAPRLDFWGVVEIQETFALVGVVTDHPNVRQGTKSVTSTLLWASED